MPIFSQNLVAEDRSNNHAVPNWQQFKIAPLGTLDQFKDWVRIEPDFINYQGVGWAMAYTDRFELVMEGKDYLLTSIEFPDHGWQISPEGVVRRFDQIKQESIRNPLLGVYEYEKAMSNAAWKEANAAPDFKQWMLDNEDKARYIKFPIHLQERYLVHPILLAVELLVGPGCYAPVPKASPKMNDFVAQTILKAYRHQLNYLDSGVWF